MVSISEEICDLSFGDNLRATQEKVISGARMTYYDVPGDGNCFFHAVAGGLLRSITKWRNLKNNYGISLCYRLAASWVTYVMDHPNETITPETHLNHQFFRYIAQNIITDEDATMYKFTEPAFYNSSVAEAREGLKAHIGTACNYADEWSIRLLNRYFGDMFKIHVYDEETENWTHVGDDQHQGFLLLSLRGLHYQLLKVEGIAPSFLVSRMNVQVSSETLLAYLLGVIPQPRRNR